MSEDLIHFVWKYSHSHLHGLKTDSGERLEVICPGTHNFDSGPDFFNAKIKLADTLWAGNVEVHVKSSDWEHHGHNSDPAYDSVILHLVAHNDKPTLNSRGEAITTLEIGYPNELEWSLQHLVGSGGWIPCASKLRSIEPLAMRMWLTGLCVERLERKAQEVIAMVGALGGAWEEAFYHSAARSLGQKINALPMELLAKSLPLTVISRCKNNLNQIEALLFGQAGMLNHQNLVKDDYYQYLAKEYAYQQQKHSLQPIPAHLWKFMRLRPVAFPTIRIAQLAMLMHRSSGLFSKLLEANDYGLISEYLSVGCSGYWLNHYRFGKESGSKQKVIGDQTIRVITLNTIVPFMFAYGKARGRERLAQRALELLEQLKPEVNSVVKGFASVGVTADSAFISQALIQLKGQYCDLRKCLFCPAGVKILLKKETKSNGGQRERTG